MDQQLEGVKQGGKAVSMVGWAYVIFGVLAILFPLLAGGAAVLAIGIIMLLGGIAGLMDAWKHRTADGFLPVIVTALTALAGLMFIFKPGQGLVVVTIVILLWLGATGMMRLIAAFQLRPREGWGWLAFDGAVSFILGLWLWMSMPDVAAWLLGLLIGIKLLFFGIVMIVTGKAVRDIASGVAEQMEAAQEVDADVVDTKDAE